jgi:hypothetical protein
MAPEELKPVLTHVQTDKQPDDLVYVFQAAWPAFEYYAEREGIPRENVKIGTDDDPRKSESDLKRVRGKRVWVVLSHIEDVKAAYVKFYLESMGPSLDSFARPGAETDLYDFRNAELSFSFSEE